MQEAVHIRFVESDDEDQPMHEDIQQPSAQPQAEPSSPPAAMHLVSAITTDFDSNDQCYVLQLVHIPTAAVVAATLSNRRVKLFALKDSGLQFSGELAGHEGRITDVTASVPDEPHILHTSSADGTVRGWDMRAGSAVETFNAPNMEIGCCSTNGTFLAAGAKDNVLIWDRRTRKPAASFTDTHAQDVTQVKFHPTSRSALLSGSDDGLIALFDIAGGLDEDEGFRAALNIDTAVYKVGWYGTQGEKMWCCSGTETLHLWDWAAACDDEQEGGNGALGEALDAREQLNLGDQKANYLLQCDYDAATDRLALAAGTSEGAVGVFPVTCPQGGGAAASIRFPEATALMTGGHGDIVRAMVYVNGNSPVWVTGGEDSRLCVWSAAAPAGTNSAGGGSSDLASRRREQLHMRRASPY